MRTAKTIFKLFILSLVLFACDAEDPAELDGSLYVPDIDIPVENAGTFTGKLNGQDYVVDVVSAILDSSTSTILITGKQGNEAISLRMPANVVPNTEPYVLGPLTSQNEYSAFYNSNVINTDSDVITVLQATTLNDFNMIIDEDTSKWVSDASNATIVGGVTTITAQRGTSGESLEFVLQASDTDTYTFGFDSENTAKYTAPFSVPVSIFEADALTNSGSITVRLDEQNKLISGDFSFPGYERFISEATSPANIDTDGDGMLDEIEIELGFDPNDACSPIMISSYTGYDSTNLIWLAADCDGDSISNEDELRGPDGDINTTDDNTNPYEGNGGDADGDGISDAQEDITDVSGDAKNNPCLPVQNEYYTGYDITNSVWSSADCDGDTIINGDELKGPDGDASTIEDNTNPFFKDFNFKQFTAGSFTNIPYAEPDVKRGLNISTHDTSASRIVGTFNFIAASIGEDPAQWGVITEGSFDVTYTVD
jgi:hypothetical protein